MPEITIHYTGPIVTRKEAIERGLIRYFDGNPCKKNHISEKRTRGYNCVQCNIENENKYRAEGKPCRTRKYYHKDLSKSRERARNQKARQRILNKNNFIEKQKIRCRDWYHKYKDIAKAANKEWRKNNIDYCRLKNKEWREKNPEKVRIMAIKYVTERKRLIKNNGGKYAIEEIFNLFDKQKGRCADCLKSIKKKYEIDHKFPLSKGGNNDIENIQLLCLKCNRKKHNKDPFMWAKENGKLL